MKALILKGPKEQFIYENVPDPTPQNGEAVAKVLACGSGLTIQHVKAGRTKVKFPIIIGHEITAEIVELRGDCGELKIGMPVTAYFYLTCGHCKWCKLNRETLCINFSGYIGRQINGGYAEYIALPAKNYIPLPLNINYKERPIETGIVTDAIATPLKVIKKARIEITDKVGVIGAGGGLGIHMLKMLDLYNIESIAIETKKNKEKSCLVSGASKFIDPNSNSKQEVIENFTKGAGLDVVIDFVSSKKSLELGVDLLGNGGRLVTLGGSGEFFNVDSGKMLLKEIELIGSRYCSKQEVIDSLDLVSRNLISPLVTEKIRPDQANDLHDRIEKGDVIGRAGIIF
ncbi:alcohol dehydrogenase catalytic domain-containing protein [Alphaproteobacteria bacterium]|nr:alcohol dehydrogenase catalytic domain-containing protein [Alphaproteobacteria bacterium]